MENKVSNIVNNLLSWNDKNMPPPYKITIFPTNMCDSHCRFCPKFSKGYGGIDFTKELSLEKWEDIIKQGLKLGVRDWEISGGGDPMAQKKKTLAIIETIKKNNPTAYCEMITNGSNFDENDIINLIKLGFDKLSISLEGTNSKDHNYMTNKKGSYEKVISTLENFKRFKRKYHTNYPKIFFNSILTNNLFKNLKELIDLAKKYDVSEIKLHPLKIFPSTKNNMAHLQLKSENFLYIEKELRVYEQLANIYNISFNYDSVLNFIVNLDLRYNLTKSADMIKEEVLTYYEQEWYDQIRLMKETGDYDKAIDFIKKLSKQYGKNPILMFQWGECLMEKKQYAESIKFMKKVILIRPKMDWVNFSIAKCYYHLNKFEQSLTFLNNNLRICKDPYSYFHSWYFKALNYEKLGNKSKLIFCLKQAKSFKIHFAKDEIPEEIHLLKKYALRKYLLFKMKGYKKKSINKKLNSIKKLIDSQRNNFKEKTLMLKRKNMGNPYIKPLLNALCYEPFYSLVIDMQGRVAPCIVSGKGDDLVNLKKLSLQQAWTGKHFEKLRKDSLKRKQKPFCTKCAFSNQTKIIRNALELSLDV